MDDERTELEQLKDKVESLQDMTLDFFMYATESIARLEGKDKMVNTQVAARELADACVHLASSLLNITTSSKDLYQAMHDVHKLQKLSKEFMEVASNFAGYDMEGYFE